MKLRFLAAASLALIALPLVSASAAVGISINIAPPILPVVVQPPCPVDGYIWVPGYWAYSPVVGYYWVPGYWAQPPGVGLLWTPPWWGYADGLYVFHEGYWGPRVGFYGGINYGYGYFGDGYWGGRWDGNVFRYNTAVTRVNRSAVRNVYVDKSVLGRRAKSTRASFNGPGGVRAEATPEQKAAASERRVPATSQQIAHQQAASKNRDLQASVNHGRPKTTAVRTLEQDVTRQTAAAGAKTAKAKAENASSIKKENAARAQTLRRNEEARMAEREREARRDVERRETEARTGKISERERVRREMAARSRRPEAVAPRDAERDEQSTDENRKRKQRKPDNNDRR